MFAGKKSAQIREILINESAWEEMTCLFAPSLDEGEGTDDVSILSKEGYNKRWEHYTTNNVFDLIEEREVIC